MEPSLRRTFNENFSAGVYEEFMQALHSKYPGAIEFRIAETPVFIPRSFGKKIIDACESITDLIIDPAFKKLTKAGIPKNETVANENAFPHMIAFDFGVCINNKGELEPQ